jgi:hypothetical protein
LVSAVTIAKPILLLIIMPSPNRIGFIPSISIEITDLDAPVTSSIGFFELYEGVEYGKERCI